MGDVLAPCQLVHAGSEASRLLGIEYGWDEVLHCTGGQEGEPLECEWTTEYVPIGFLDPQLHGLGTAALAKWKENATLAERKGQRNECVSQSKHIRNRELKEAYAEAAIGGLAILGEIALIWRYGDELDATEIIHLGPVLAVGPVLYFNGVMNATQALDDHDARVAKCDLQTGYPDSY